MESCGSTHDWARFAQSHGQKVKAIYARTVKSFLQGQKTDANDAIAISMTALQPNVTSCRLISVEAQTLQNITKLDFKAEKSNSKSDLFASLVGGKVVNTYSTDYFFNEFKLCI